MKSIGTIVIGILLLVTLHLQAVVLVVTKIPAYTPTTDTVYATGSFNNWNPKDTAFALKLVDNKYMISIPSSQFSYKFTRGSWAAVEGNSMGTFLPNRNYSGLMNDTIQLEIQSWEDLHGSQGGGNHSPNVQVLDPQFFMPQLNRYRRIWIYLPQNYSESAPPYPVIYMHDGQNLFDPTTSFAGEWGVDETMDKLVQNGDSGAIIVGIDNGGAFRTNELAPYFNTQYNAGGEGDEYLDFIIQTLKPFIDFNYNTDTRAAGTWLFGSSLGGLISMYGAARNPDVFGKAGIFSPAYWFNAEIYDFVAKANLNESKVYQLAGGKEAGVVNRSLEMDSILTANGFNANQLLTKIVPNGQHAEWFWKQEFEEAYRWLRYDDLSTSIAKRRYLMQAEIMVYPNPIGDMMNITTSMQLPQEVMIYNAMGSLIQRLELKKPYTEIPLSHLEAGVYWLASANRIFMPMKLIKK